MFSRTAITIVLATFLALGAMPLAQAAGNFNVVLTPGTVSTDRLSWVTLTASVTSATNDCAGTPRTFVFSWGDGTNTTTLVSSASSVSASHKYNALGSFSASVIANGTAACGRFPTDDTPVTVVNHAPTASLAPVADFVAGTPITLSASATDTDGTIASYVFSVDGVARPAQAGSSLGVTITSAGAHTASVVAIDNDGAQSAASSVSFQVAAAPLASIAVSGPASLVAGESGAYALAGADAYGNPVALAQPSTTFSSNVAGPAVVSYTESGVTGSLGITVVAAALDSITVSGPATLVAGESGTYALAGADAYGNAVPLAQPSTTFSSTTAGPAVVSYTESGVTGSLGITVVAAALDSITVTGPTTLAAGEVGTYGLAGFDAYGNAVALAQPSTTFSSNVAGPAVVSYTESGVTGSLAIEVVPAALDSITVSGPTTLVAGESGTYALEGFDAFGNAVELSQAETTFSSNVAGPAVVSYTESGVTGSLDVEVVAAALDHITISGPATLVAGTTGTYAVAGFDAFENSVPLAVASIDVPAGTSVGTLEVFYEESGITSNVLEVQVVAAALDSITIAGPATLVAGTTGTYAVAGFDAFENSVPLAVASIDVPAGTSVGTIQVLYEESGVTSNVLDVEVVAAALARISVSGPDTLVAGTSATYGLAGFDAFDNPVGLAQGALEFTAPTTAGVATVSYTEAGVTGSLDVLIVADALDTITVAGPESGVAGTLASFTAEGADRYGNGVALAVPAFDVTLSTVAGTQSVCHEEQGITGCTSIEVLADALAQIVIGGPDAMQAGSTVEFDLAGFDQYGNAVPLAQATVPHTAGWAVGVETVSYEESGIRGEKLVEITPVPLDVGLAFASTRAADTAVEGLRGSVSVHFPGDGPVEGASVTVVILRNVQGLGNVHNETIVGTTGADGEFDFTASPLFSLPGRYNVLVRVSALGSTGSEFQTINIVA